MPSEPAPEPTDTTSDQPAPEPHLSYLPDLMRVRGIAAENRIAVAELLHRMHDLKQRIAENQNA